MLDAGNLRAALRPLFDPASMPSANALGVWVRSYAEYAKTAIAGPVALAAPLSSPASGPFTFAALDSALQTMWMAAIWVGPGVTAVTTAVPPLTPLLVALAPSLIVSYDTELAPTLIAEALHTYTLSVVVTVTPATGSPFPATLV